MSLMAVAALATAILRCARLFLIEQALCRTHYAIADPSLVRPDGSVDESLCKLDNLQADLALVSGLYEVITLLSGEMQISKTGGLLTTADRLDGHADLDKTRLDGWEAGRPDGQCWRFDALWFVRDSGL